MDTTTIIIIALGVLLILGVGLIWLKQKGTGTFEGRVGGTEFKMSKKETQKSNQAEQIQKYTIGSTQEQPKGANAKQTQENTEDSHQTIR